MPEAVPASAQPLAGFCAETEVYAWRHGGMEALTERGYGTGTSCSPVSLGRTTSQNTKHKRSREQKDVLSIICHII